MTEIIIIVGIGGIALLLWHKRQVAATNTPPPYLGVRAWPTMPPLMVPDISLPFGYEQEATYYGYNASIVEQYTK